MKLNFLLLFFPLIFFFQSCENGEAVVDDSGTAAEVASSIHKTETHNRKLIKKGDLKFETGDISKTRSKIMEAARKYKAYVSKEDEAKLSNRFQIELTLRVPSENFNSLVDAVSNGVKSFDTKEISLNDVTEEYVDIEARLKSKKELENRYLTLLKKTKNVEEILKVERELSDIRTEIERIEGRLQYLKNRVSLSTLNIEFYKPIPKQTQFGQKFKNAFQNGWENLLWFLLGLSNLWPFLLLGAIGVIALMKYENKKKKKNT